jgi:hypothetical protein
MRNLKDKFDNYFYKIIVITTLERQFRVFEIIYMVLKIPKKPQQQER